MSSFSSFCCCCWINLTHRKTKSRRCRPLKTVLSMIQLYWEQNNSKECIFKLKRVIIYSRQPVRLLVKCSYLLSNQIVARRILIRKGDQLMHTFWGARSVPNGVQQDGDVLSSGIYCRFACFSDSFVCSRWWCYECTSWGEIIVGLRFGFNVFCV